MADDTRKLYRLDAFIKADIPEPPALIESILPGGATMILAGQHKVGKTVLLAQIAMCVASGSRWLHWQTYPVPVLYLNYEVAAWSFRSRIYQQLEGMRRAAGDRVVDPIHQNLYTVSLPDLKLDRPRDLEWLGRRTIELGVGLVVIDPLRGAFTGNRNSDEETDTVMQNLVEKVIDPSGAAVIIGHHMRKPPPGEMGTGSTWEIKGSGGWSDAADAIVTIRPDKTESLKRYLAFTLRHYESPDDLSIRLRPASLLFEPYTDPHHHLGATL